MNDQCARKANALAHPAGQLARIRRFEAVEPDEVDRLERALAHFRRRQAQRLESDLHVLEHSQPGKQRKALEYHRNARGRPGDRIPEVAHFAGRRRVKSRDSPQERRFARAGAAEKTDDLPFTEREVHAFQYDELIAVRLAKSLADALHVQQGNGVHEHLRGKNFNRAFMAGAALIAAGTCARHASTAAARRTGSTARRTNS